MQEYPKEIQKLIRKMQKGEITEYYVYLNIAKRVKDKENKKILEEIANQEKAHNSIWEKYTKEKIKPNKFKIFFYSIMSIFFGYTFTLKLMEKGENHANSTYLEISKYAPDALKIATEEDEHEQKLISLLNEESLNYVGSIVLGLNDALVELSGALAGLTLALADPKIISVSGLITGIAASLSMASSEYLSSKAEGKPNALKSAIYTGIAYIITVAILIIPYLLLGDNKFLALGIMLISVVLIILFFNYYISVAKDLPFKKRFLQMTIISLSVAAISFGIGFFINIIFGI